MSLPSTVASKCYDILILHFDVIMLVSILYDVVFHYDIIALHYDVITVWHYAMTSLYHIMMSLAYVIISLHYTNVIMLH